MAVVFSPPGSSTWEQTPPESEDESEYSGELQKGSEGGADGEEGSQALGGEQAVLQARRKKWVSWKEKGPLPYQLSPGRQPTLGKMEGN